MTFLKLLMQQVIQFPCPDPRHLTAYTLHKRYCLRSSVLGCLPLPIPLVHTLPRTSNNRTQRYDTFSWLAPSDSLDGLVPKFFLMSIPVFSLATSNNASYTSTFVVAS